MSFTRYNSIDNQHNSKVVSYWLNNYPELQDEDFVLREKLDGSNIGIYFNYDTKRDGNVAIRIGSRNNYLGYYGEDTRFEGVNLTDLFQSKTGYIKLIERLTQMTLETERKYILFGEFYGKINRVKYRDSIGWRIFDIKVDDEMMTQFELENLINSLDLSPEDKEDLMCPLIAKVNGLTEAMNYSVDRNSLLTPEGYDKPNISEEFVIKPLHKVYVKKACGSIFMLKKKHPKFKETEKDPNKPKKEIDSSLAAWNVEFRKYINRNRVVGIYSKYGEIEKQSQIGQYIIWTLEDAKEDFKKDFPEYKSSKNDDRIVFNVGNAIVNLLKENL